MRTARGPEQSDRRSVPRFPLPVGRVTGETGSESLLNLGRRGMALEVPIADGFQAGESRLFTLSDLSHSVEVRARVCWARSVQKERLPAGGFESMQISGLEFEEILPQRPDGIWRNLEAVPRQDGGKEDIPPSAEAPVGSTVSLIRLVEPEDGSYVRVPLATFVCKLTESSEVSSVSINGIEATLEGDLTRADLELSPGVNKLRAIVRQLDGTYRTCLLGSVYWRVD